MKLLTWNVNGIRSLPEPLEKILANLKSDVCCFQETKITRDMLTSDVALTDNFQACFSFCRKRSGYSGVVTYFGDEFAPVAAEDGLTNVFFKPDCNSTPVGHYPDITSSSYSIDQFKSLDGEGRAVITKHVIKTRSDGDCLNLHIINVYCPRLDPDKPERKTFKLDFYRLLKLRVEEILKASDKNHVIIAGDLNCSHRRIDHCEPDDDPDFDDNESRKFLTSFFYDASENKAGIMVDVFRQIYPNREGAFTCWCTKLSARQTNYGTRIDYILMDRRLFEENIVSSIRHCTEVLGSDHCPVLIDLNIICVPSQRLPDICTKFMPEFRGVQQKLTHFLVKRTICDEKIDSKSGKPQVKRTKVVQTLRDCYDFVAFSGDKGVSKNNSTQSMAEIDSSGVPVLSAQSSSNSASNGCSANESKEQWKSIFKASTSKVPLCRGHNEPCVLRTVKKQGPNLNKQFYCCARGLGRKDDKSARCNFFKWLP